MSVMRLNRTSEKFLGKSVLREISIGSLSDDRKEKDLLSILE
jgi:hypothetical protein